MKKFLATILAIVYLTSSMGATVHLHYCMGKFMSWGLADQENKSCTFCGMAKQTSDEPCISTMDGCCKDEYKTIKTNDDQKPSEPGFEFSKLIPDATLISHNSLSISFLSSISIDKPTANAPPTAEKVSIFLINCNFRI